MTTENAQLLENAKAKLGLFDQLATSGINVVILWVLALSSLVLVLDAVGFLPARVSNFLNRNGLRETMRLLREFGVDVETPSRINRVAGFENVSQPLLADRVNARIDQAKISGKVQVGSQIEVAGEHYHDLMGATTDPKVAKAFARDLAALWRSLTDRGGPVAHYDIDFVVTPKTGSPLLGAAFAESLRKPLLLHNPERKFLVTPTDPRALFDCLEVPEKGSRGLIVDDSSTGGGKAARLIADLRSCGWVVDDFIVVFEPQIKAGTGQNAAARLKPTGVTLHSIVKT
jgi:adenine/guanine phosphoribosyltransferase-like PRPP-binding protein